MDRQILRISCCLAGLCAVSACSQSSRSLVGDSAARLSISGSSPADWDQVDHAPICRELPANSPLEVAHVRTAPRSAAQPRQRSRDVEPATAQHNPVEQVEHRVVRKAGRPAPPPAADNIEPTSPFAAGVARTMGHNQRPQRGTADRLRLTSHDDPPAGDARPVPAAAELEFRAFVSTAMVAADESAITLGEIEAMALERNPAIRQAAAIAQKGVGTHQQVGLCPNPTIGYSGQEIGGDGTAGQQGMYVEQTFVRGDKLELNQNVATQEVQRLLWQVQVQRQKVLTDVRQQYYATLGAQLRIAMTAELEGLAADAAEKFKLLFENAQGSRADQLQAEILKNEISILRQQAENERAANWRQLANLMGSPGMQPVTLAGSLEDGGAPREWEQSVAHLLSASPQLQQAYAEAQRAYASIRRAEVQKIPNVELQASTAYFVDNDNVGANLTVGLPIPFFNKNQGNIHRAWSDYHRAQCNVQRLTLSSQARLAAAFGDYRDAAIRVNVMQQEILPRQAESVELIEKGFGTQFDFLRLFSARRSYYDARVQYLNALVALRQQEVLIDGLLLTGALDEVADTDIDDGMRDAALDGR